MCIRDRYLNSWNVAHETNKAPDVGFLQDLCNKLKTYENVDGSKIRIIGFSNGAGLANRAYIALDDSGVDQIVTIATSFIAPMYKNNNFHMVGPNMELILVKNHCRGTLPRGRCLEDVAARRCLQEVAWKTLPRGLCFEDIAQNLLLVL